MMEYLIEKFTTGVASNGKTYATLKLRDKTGTIEGKIWDYNPVDALLLSAGNVIRVDGVVSMYQGSPQIKITYVEKSDTPASTYALQSKFDVNDLYSKIVAMVEDFKEELTREVTIGLLGSFSKEEICTAPAATSVHNNWCGGLIEHIWSMLNVGDGLIQWYKSNYFPSLSSDKVKFGIIAHDLGKIREYNINNPAFPKTVNGVLVNHLILGPAMVYQIGMEHLKNRKQPISSVDEFELNHLMHIVSAHHGHLDWGSPVKPSTIEALIVHHLDLIDSKILHAVKLIEEPDLQNLALSKWSKFENLQFVRPLTITL